MKTTDLIHLPTIDIAYKDAFPRTLLSALDSNANRSLFELAKTRNAIVHKAGRADEKFVNEMVTIENPIPEFANLEDGDILPIDGEIVSRLITNSIDACVNLIEQIDGWLSPSEVVPDE